MAILVKGTAVKLELEDGTIVSPPEQWGMVHDTNGTLIRKCIVLVLPYRKCARHACGLTPSEHQEAVAYYGQRCGVQRVFVDLPPGPWHRMHDAVRIYYVRRGKKRGGWHHPYRTAVVCFEHHDLGAYALVLPAGCRLESRGFVWP